MVTGPRFEIVRRIGAGGMGVVFEAHDHVRGQRVALKTLRRVDPTALFLFKREFRLLSEVRHPNLVTLGELVHERGRWLFTMELIDGLNFREYCGGASVALATASRPLEDTPTAATVVEDPRRAPPRSGSRRGDRSRRDRVAVRARGVGPSGSAPTLEDAAVGAAPPFDEERVREALHGLCRGLLALHAAGRVHRDLKPANVLVTGEGRVVLLDFGLVAPLEGDGLTARLSPWGTPRYMAPEACDARHRLGPPADLYALGVMLYEALAGRPPFLGKGDALLVAKTSKEAPPPSAWGASLPADLEALAIALVRRDPRERPTAEAVMRELRRKEGLAESERVIILPLLARRRELAMLDEALRAATDRDLPHVVLCEGGAGQGKTRLMTTWLASVRQREEAFVFAGSSYEEGAVPFQALDGPVDELADFLSERPDLAAGCLPSLSLAARLFPVLARALPKDDGAVSHGAAPRDTDRGSAFVALCALLRAVAATGPLVLFLDDAHWADADSALFLTTLLEPAETGPLLVLAAYRPRVEAGPPCKMIDALSAAMVPRTSISLSPFGPVLSELDARSLSDTLGSDEEGAAALLEASGGRPLDLTELARHRFGGGRRNGEGPMPRTYEEALGLRLGALCADDRSLLSVMAVARRPLPLATAILAGGLTGPAGRRARFRLLGAGLLRVGGTLGPAGMDVAHDRVRGVVRDTLTREEALALHVELASALRLHLPTEPDRIAEHLEAAGDRRGAEPFFVRAAEGARATLAYARAAELYERAASTREEDDPRRLDLLVSKGECESLAGYGLSAADSFLAVARALDGGPQRDRTQDLRRRAAEQLLVSGRQREGMLLLREVCRGVGLPAPSSSLLAAPLLALETVRLHRRGLLEGDPTLPRAPDDDLRVNAARTAARALSIVDTLTAAYYQTLHLRLSLDTGEPAHLLYAYALSAGFAAAEEGSGGRRTEAFLRRNRELGDRCLDPLGPATLALSESVVAYCRGQFARSVAASELTLERYAQVGGDIVWDIGTARTFRFLGLGMTGRLPLLAAEAAEAQHEADLRRDLYSTSFFQTGAVPWIALARGDGLAAREALAAAVGRHRFPAFSWAWFLSRVHLVLLEIQADDAPAAHRVLNGLRAPPIPLLLAKFRFHRVLTWWLRGAAAARALEHEPTALLERAYLLRAVRRLVGDGEPYALALAHGLRAAWAQCRGQHEAAHLAWVASAEALLACDLLLFAAAAFDRAARTAPNGGGRSHAARARVLYAGCGVDAPEALAATLAPGLPGS